MSEDLQSRVDEMNKVLTDIRIEQAKQGGSVNDLLGWRDQFQRDIKDTLNQMNNKMDKELYEMGKSITTLNEKMDEQNKELHAKIDSNQVKLYEKMEKQSHEQSELLRQATGKLPLWASILISTILVGAGWAVEIAVSHH